MRIQRRVLLTLLVGLVPAALAQPPGLPGQVTVIGTFPPGAALGRIARILIAKLNSMNTAVFRMEVRAGRNGALGARAAAQAPADGSVWLIAPDAIFTATPALYPGVFGFDPERDLKIVLAVGFMPAVL